MTNLRGHLLGGSVLAAAFLGIGKGIQAPPAPGVRTEPKLAKPVASSKDDDLEDDDDALDDDNEGEDAPDDDDSEDEKAEKRKNRRARKAARVKAEKKAKKEKAEGDDDDEAEMRGNSPVAQARHRERARCAAIFASEAAADNLEMAAHLAFNTKLTRNEAIVTLEQAPKGKSGLAHAMSSYAGRGPGQDAPAPDASKAAASGWDKALGSRRAKKA